MFQSITEDQSPLPGDYIRYADRFGQPKGRGILLKHVLDKRRPLTESYYLLKNAQSGRIWKVYCDRFTFTFMRHRTKNAALSDWIRGLSMSYDEDQL